MVRVVRGYIDRGIYARNDDSNGLRCTPVIGLALTEMYNLNDGTVCGHIIECHHFQLPVTNLEALAH